MPGYRQMQMRQGHYDKTLMWVLLCLLGFGLIMVYSASVAQAGLHNYANRAVFFIKQCQFAVIGILLAALLCRVPMWRWLRWTKLLLPFALIFLAIVPLVGEEINGAKRWLPMPGGLKIQPSEIFKLMTILYMASFFKRRLEILHDFGKVKWVAVPIGLGIGFILLTRDLGSAMVVFAIALVMLFLANLPARWFAMVVGIGISVAATVIATSDFRMRRMSVMWQPWKDPTGTGYQSMGSLMSMERGGWFGEGLGNGVFKRGFLPEAHTDFILAVIAEELGLVTVTLLIFCYAWIVWRAFSIGRNARDLDLHFNSFVAIGIGVWVAVQSFINIGVNISLLPNKGLTLPLISYGGSSLVIIIVGLTILLRVDYENKMKIKGITFTDPHEAEAERKRAQAEAAEAGDDDPDNTERQTS
ncbi:putative lipid II flippase FtsW [Conchiformibius kuhniae]|uniref:Probable peptidoglycan glycosyltransferase FtsW n=1 Tax=Conchiformibius kuhniae TaxID=211502 RepID=A0ABD8B8G6_9NEIS|nr:putative lipid II flippase FtsW [Conchiformibius kuhniae]